MRRLLLLNALLGLALGCGTGAYESRIGTRKMTSKFDNFSAAEQLPGTKVSIRVPSNLVQPPGADDKRVKPGVFAVPGLARTYEGFIKDSEGGEWPYYCYIGVVEGSGAQNITNNIRGELAAHPNHDMVEWQDFQSEMPDGRGNVWKKLRFTADQEFFVKDKNGQGAYRPNIAGLLEVYVHEEQGATVVVAWRLPSFIEASVGLSDLARLTTGGVSVAP